MATLPQVVPCADVDDHDHEECPFAHPLEKARRRDVRAVNYIDSACPDFRKVRLLNCAAPLLPVHTSRPPRTPQGAFH